MLLFLETYVLKVYNSVSNHCGIPQLAKKLNQVGLWQFFIELLSLLTIIYILFLIALVILLDFCDWFIAFQILEQHIRKDLPRLKAVLNSRMHAAMKELQTYGDVVESKVSCHSLGNVSGTSLHFLSLGL